MSPYKQYKGKYVNIFVMVLEWMWCLKKKSRKLCRHFLTVELHKFINIIDCNELLWTAEFPRKKQTQNMCDYFQLNKSNTIYYSDFLPNLNDGIAQTRKKLV